MKKLGLATVVLLAMTGAQAYQVEVQGQSQFIDNTVNEHDFTGAVAGTYYFKNVDSSKGPLAEAAFLNQASNVSAAYTYGEYDVDGIANQTSHTVGLKGEVYANTNYSANPLYASAAYSYSYANKKDNQFDDHGQRLSVEVGSVIAPNLLVAVGYTNAMEQVSYDAFNMFNNGVAQAALESKTINDDQDAFTARTKYVGAIDGTNMSIGFDAGLVYGEQSAYNLGANLFINPQLSVGVSYLETDINEAIDSAFGANVNYFFTPAFAVGASYTGANAKGAHQDTQTIGLNAKVRF